MVRITNENPESKSVDIVAENIEKASLALKELFPEIVTESDGKKTIDFEVLKEILGEAVEDKEERYNFTWHGKSKARQLAQAPSAGTLRPCKEESVDWDTTENLFIEGDNLEVLKLLQKSYHKKVKMIYIDPPYNTGKEFIYPDKYQDNLDTYLRYTGQKDGEGFKISSNTESSGRYHTNWLNMMYPRLKLARNLLTDDGVIFISIDDNEQANLRKICDEIFGESNFIGMFIVNSSPSAIDYGHIAKTHDYALFYSKDILRTTSWQLEEKDKKFKYSDETGQFNLYPLYNGNVAFNPVTRPNLYYPFYLNPKNTDDNGFYEISVEKKYEWIEVFPVISNKDGISRVWRWGKIKSKLNINTEIVGYKTNEGDYRIVQKTRHTGKVIRSLQVDKTISSRKGTMELQELFKKKVFSFPKPVELIRRFTCTTTEEKSLVLDFFSGTSPTAHAVLDLNKEDNGKRKFIMVQLPEPCDEHSEAHKAGYKTIAEIGKERIRRAAAKIKKEHPEYQGDLGFKVFKLDSTNIKPWDANYDTLEDDLLSSVESLKPDRSAEDILHEILLKYGMDLTLPVTEHRISGKTVFEVNSGELLVCLEDGISLEVAEGIGALAKKLSPEIVRVVFKDSGFADDIVKTNTMQVLKQFGIDDVKSI